MRRGILVIVICCLGATVAASAQAPAAKPAAPVGPAVSVSPATNKRTGKVTADVIGLQSSAGRVLASVFCSKNGFPNKVARACATKLVKIVNKRARLEFDSLPAGQFAMALFHDENANSKLDTNLFGMPSEGWGASRDAQAHMGPPDWEDARMTLALGEHKHIIVHMQY